MPSDDDVSVSSGYDDILDRILAGQVEDVEALLAAEPSLTPEQRDELRALGGAFGRPAPEAEPDDDEPPFRSVADFHLLKRLGGGGAGVVWLARQPGLERSVALKILRPGLAFSDEAAARFDREGQALARLRHPNIVSVIASGTKHTLRWIAMEYVAGEGLDEILRTGDPEATRPSIIQAVSWCRDVARALACSHEAGIVHRDVKPSNIRITYEGRAVLVDFGLAWQAGGETLTQTGGFRGSPRYASPEQVSTRSSAIDGRTDVYSLGVTLYEAVTGRPPYEGDSTEQLFAAILEGDATPPRTIRQDIPRELETVIQTAMERDPKRRYAGAQQLADDLDALLALKDILAKPPSPLRRVQKAVRRHPAAAMAIAAGLLVAAALTINHFAQAAADRNTALSEARSQLAAYRETRDRALTLELSAAKLDEEIGLHAMSSEDLAKHGQGDSAARAARVEADTLFQSAFDRAASVLARDPSAGDARELLADLCLERWRESLRMDDPRMMTHWRDQVRGYDPAGRHAAELDGLGMVTFSVTPPEASTWIFRYREEAEVVPGGGRRLVPVPPGALPPTVQPGSQCLRVVRRVGEVQAGDVILELGGHPVDGCFVESASPPVQRHDLLVSIDGEPVRHRADLFIATARRQAERRTFVFDRGGARIETRTTLDDLALRVVRPDVAASFGGIGARAWREGRIVDLDLPPGGEYRMTAAPLFASAACRASTAPDQPLEPGSWLALVSAPGFETQRVPFVVPRGGEVEVTASLRPAGSTPPEFVFIPAGIVQITSRHRRRGGIAETGPRDVAAFAIMEREVTVQEFLEFLNDRATPQAARDALLTRAKPHGDRPAFVWARVQKRPDGTLEPQAVGDAILPMNGVSFREAKAYAAWATAQSRGAGLDLVFDLPTDLELMRAACGVDGRRYSYGSWFSPPWQKAAASRTHIFSEPPLSFPVDESPFGVFDLTGSLEEWCVSSDLGIDGATGQGVLGGSFLHWSIDPLTNAMSFGPDAEDPNFGFRLAIHWRAPETR